LARAVVPNEATASGLSLAYSASVCLTTACRPSPTHCSANDTCFPRGRNGHGFSCVALDARANENFVAVLDDVVLAFGVLETGGLEFALGAETQQIVDRHDVCADEAAG